MSHSTFYHQITETFHWFHQNPELSFEEYETTGRIREFLEHRKVHILDLDLKTGLVAEIQGANDGPVIALRCDIDALPVQEETGLPYASAITGKMHACGHDFHTTVMLYVAKKLQEQREHFQGKVKILFQPASQIVTLAQSIVSRNIDPFSQGLLSITRITAGNTWNVIPQTAELEGTIRTMGRHNRRLMEERFRSLVQHIALSQGAAAEIHWLAGPPATNNAPCFAPVAAAVAKDQGLWVKTSSPSLGGEDFAFYQEKVPGFFIRIGTGDSYPNHHPKFQIDTNALTPAVDYFAALAVKTLSAIKSGELIPVQEEADND